MDGWMNADYSDHHYFRQDDDQSDDCHDGNDGDENCDKRARDNHHPHSALAIEVGAQLKEITVS